MRLADGRSDAGDSRRTIDTRPRGLSPDARGADATAAQRYADYDDDALIEKLEALLAEARERRARERALSVEALPLDAVEVPEPDPAPDDPIPSGIETLDKWTDAK